MATPAVPCNILPCEECKKLGTQSCGGCKQSRYCSVECQKKGWKVHKHLCKTFKDFQDRPTSDKSDESFTRAILFDSNDNGPRFVWLRHSMNDDDGEIFLSTSVDEFLRNEEERTEDEIVSEERRSFYRNRVLSRGLPHEIDLSWRSRFVYDGSLANKAVNGVVNKKSKYMNDWRGPIVAIGYKHHENEPLKGVDLDTADLRHIVDWFNWYFFRGTDIQMREIISGHFMSHMVEAVRINCDGDCKSKKVPRYEAIEIPDTHPVFKSPMFIDYQTPISKRIGLPIVARMATGPTFDGDHRNPHDLLKHARLYMNAGSSMSAKEKVANRNQQAKTLDIGCDPSENPIDTPPFVYRSWGRPMKAWDVPGSVIVARQDQKPLLPQHCEALVEFCQLKDKEVFQKYRDGDLADKLVHGDITSQEFHEFYEAWVLRQEHEEVRKQACPFAI